LLFVGKNAIIYRFYCVQERTEQNDILNRSDVQYRRQSLASSGAKWSLMAAHSERYIRKNPGHSPDQRANFSCGTSPRGPSPAGASAADVDYLNILF